MSKKFLVTLAASAALAAATAGDPPRAETPITRLSVFKNGVVAVQRSVKSDAAEFTIPGDIVPSVGSLWFKPFEGVRIANMHAEEEDGSFSALYAGKPVTVDCLFGNEVRSYTGIVTPPKKKPLKFNHFNSSRSGGGNYGDDTVTLDTGNASGRFLTISRGSILAVAADELPAPDGEKETGMVVSRPDADAGKPLSMQYLTKGMLWSPAYKLELVSGKTLRLSMSAVVVNELEEFSDAEVELISGYPNLPFANTPDPLASVSSYGQAYGASNQWANAPAAMSRKAMVAADFAMAEEAGMELDEGAAPVSEDMQSRELGKLSMRLGEKLYLPLDSAETEYENVVEWRLNACRNNNGRAINANGGNPDLWDCLKFKNPFANAITAGPAEVVSGGQVTGQNRLNWVNPREETLFKVTKALTVAGKLIEEEEVKNAGSSQKSGSDVVYLYGYKYRRAVVNGAFSLKNYRSTPVKVVTVIPVNGTLLECEGDPQTTHPANELFGVNQPNLLTWESSIEPGGEATVKYKYEVLVLL